jgi:hypothetical protein
MIRNAGVTTGDSPPCPWNVSARKTFPLRKLKFRVMGNVFAAISYLDGLAVEDLRRFELDYYDPDYEIVIMARLRKPSAGN